MRLRAISLCNIRRFTEPVRIEGIADGVNVLSAPNEFGKSTVFDALRALFFVPHGSRAKDITQLRPHAGGAPEVSVELEIDDGRFVVAKRWLSKPEARVMRNGILVAQADEAEAWISRQLGGGDGGPSGLLWVRQGIIGLSDGSNKEQQAALDARRDLLSSVTGEVEAMTGGRRMDSGIERCRSDLESFASPTGKAKANGPWKKAIDQVEELRSQRDTFAQLVQRLQTALEVRTSKRQELAEIEDPDAARTRAERLIAAKDAHAAAEAHASKVEAGETTVQVAQAAAERARSELAALQTANADLETAQTNVTAAQASLAEVTGDLVSAEETFAAAASAHESAEAELKAIQELVRRVEARAAATAAQERREELQERLDKALAARQSEEACQAEASVGPDETDMESLQRLSNRLATARALREASATRISIRYAAGCAGSISIASSPIDADRDLSVYQDTTLAIREVGQLSVHPGDGPRNDKDVERAEAALAKALAAWECSTLDEARMAHRRRKDASDSLTRLKAELSALAPRGIEDLQRQLAALPKQNADGDEPLPTLAEVEAGLEAARGKTAELSVALEVARERRDGKRTAHAEAKVRSEAAVERLAAAQAAIERLPAKDVSRLSSRFAMALETLEVAKDGLAKLRAVAPDVKATEAALSRAQSIEAAARRRVDELRPALAALDERIAGTSGEAVEERLQETEEKLLSAEERLARIEREVRVLQRLLAALEAARSEARDRYFAPVASELRPLLHLLWPDAELHWANDTLLPQSLTRHGQEEPVEVLSGGTQEQIALLVRLAFARLLAKDGRHAPVILDDALVFTDDDRIERMFDALHRQASDLQIIVLSCRQRAFRDLGGTTLEIVA